MGAERIARDAAQETVAEETKAEDTPADEGTVQRSLVERGFGHDFGSVRIHRDALQRKLDTSCSNSTIVAEINKFKFAAARKIARANRLLASNPVSSTVAAEVKRWFLFDVDDKSSLAVVRGRIKAMADLMLTTDVLFICRDMGEKLCGGRYGARSTNCSNDRGTDLCADLAFFNAGAVKSFMSPPVDWEEIFIHEYVHLSCTGGSLVFDQAAESYKARATAAEAMMNPWNYSNFIRSV